MSKTRIIIISIIQGALCIWNLLASLLISDYLTESTFLWKAMQWTFLICFYAFLIFPIFGNIYNNLLNWLVITLFLFMLKIQNSFFYGGELSIIIVGLYVLIYILYFISTVNIIKNVRQYANKDLFHKLLYIFPYVSIIVVVIAIINSYSLIYIGMESGTFSIKLNQYLDSFYFSVCTYFTVGYGDIKPIAYLSKVLVSSEIIVSHVITVLFIPVIINYTNNKKNPE
jgi:hypothetical protein